MSALLILVLLAAWTAAALGVALLLGAVIARRERQRPRQTDGATVGRAADPPGTALAHGVVRRSAGCRSAGLREVRPRRNHRS